MAQLVISLNNQIIKRIKLTEPSYLIGRSSKCDIVLPERTVSSQHARLVNAGEECFLEDLQSTNGVLINGAPAHRYLLMDNDAIQIGKYHLLFRSAIGLVTQLRQLSVHPRMLDESEDIAVLEIMDGKKKGHVIPLLKNQITLGGNVDGISPITVERNLAGDFLLHALSERKIKTVTKLQDGDTFEIGEIELKFHQAPKTVTL